MTLPLNTSIKEVPHEPTKKRVHSTALYWIVPVIVCLFIAGCDQQTPSEADTSNDADYTPAIQAPPGKVSADAQSLEAHIEVIYRDIIFPVSQRVKTAKQSDINSLQSANEEVAEAQLDLLITEKEQALLLSRVQQLLLDHPELADISKEELQSVLESVSANVVSEAAKGSLGKSQAATSGDCTHCDVALAGALVLITTQHAQCLARCALPPCVLLCEVQHISRLAVALGAYYGCLLACGGHGGGDDDDDNCPNPGPDGCVNPEKQ